ncbi:MAG: hypothetical protein Q8R25_02285 [bacterium]|nr:hypothetical protein [bacterium]
MYIRLLGDRGIPAFDDAGAPNQNPFWYIQTAIDLDWDVVAIDPYHRDGFDGIFHERRDPGMAQAIERTDRMIALVGVAHLPGIRTHLGEKALYVHSFLIPKEGPLRNIHMRFFGRKLFEFLETIPSLA